MLGKIINTVGSRLLMTVFSFLLAVATTHFLEVEGRGEVSLFVLNITIVVAISNFVGGPSLVYLVPRHHTGTLLVYSIGWAVAASAVVTAGLWLSGILSNDWVLHVFAVGWLQSVSTALLMILLGKDEVAKHNLLSVSAVIIQVSGFAGGAWLLQEPTVETFIYAMYAAQLLVVALGLTLVRKHIPPGTWKGLGRDWKPLLHYGLFSNLGSLASQLVNRATYYLLEHKTTNGTYEVGVYSIGVTVSEALWLVSRSISLVQYAAIANSDDRPKARELTVTLLKFNLIATAALLIPALALPGSFYAFVFGKPDYEAVRMVLLFLCPGILAYAAAGSLAHYFSGTGQHHVNAIGSGLALVTTLGLGMVLIPTYHWQGAAITTVVSYLVNSAYLLIIFMRETKYSLRVFIPAMKDFQQFVERFREKISQDLWK